MREREVIIVAQDLRRAGFCHKGGRRFCARHGLDWSDFLRNGMRASVLLSTNDAMAKRLVEVVMHGK